MQKPREKQVNDEVCRVKNKPKSYNMCFSICSIHSFTSVDCYDSNLAVLF